MSLLKSVVTILKPADRHGTYLVKTCSDPMTLERFANLVHTSPDYPDGRSVVIIDADGRTDYYHHDLLCWMQNSQVPELEKVAKEVQARREWIRERDAIRENSKRRAW